MANGVQKNRSGPFWPLGNIAVVTPGTPVNMMSLVDSANTNAPQTATTPINAIPQALQDEYTVRCCQIIIQGMKSNGGNGLTNNTGNIYVIQKGSPSPGTNNRSDLGAIVLTVASGLTAVIAAPPGDFNILNPYQLWIDGDNASDGAQVTLVIAH